MRSEIRFNSFFDRKQDFLYIIPGQHAAAWGVILCAVVGPWVIIAQFFDEPLWSNAVVLLVFIISILTYTFLVKDGESQFFGEFYKPKELTLTNQRLIMTPKALKPKVKKGKDSLAKVDILPIENITDLVCPFEINRKGVTAGGFLSEKFNRQRFFFCYELRGISSTINEQSANRIAENLSEVLKDFFVGESLTLNYQVQCNADAELDFLSRLSESNISEEVKHLNEWQKRGAKDLIRRKLNRPKKLYVIFSYTPNRTETLFDFVVDTFGELSNYLAPLMRIFGLAPKKSSILNNLQNQFDLAFEEGYQSQKYYLEKLGFQSRPMSAQECWQYLWGRINYGPAPRCPLIMVSDKEGLQHHYDNERIVRKDGAIEASDPMVLSRTEV